MMLLFMQVTCVNGLRCTARKFPRRVAWRSATARGGVAQAVLHDGQRQEAADREAWAAVQAAAGAGLWHSQAHADERFRPSSWSRPVRAREGGWRAPEELGRRQDPGPLPVAEC